MEPVLGEKPCAVELHEGVELTERRNHQAPLPAVDRHEMRQAGSLARAGIICQREGALPDEVRGGVLFVQLGEHWRKRLERMQLLRRTRIFGVHTHHEVGVCG